MVVSKVDLWGSYCNIRETIAYKDLWEFFQRKKARAMEKLKLADDPVARATWILIDDIDNYIERKQKEAIDEQTGKNR